MSTLFTILFEQITENIYFWWSSDNIHYEMHSTLSDELPGRAMGTSLQPS